VQMASTLRLAGTASVTLMVAPQALVPQTVTQVRVYLAVRSNSTVTQIAMGEASFSFSGTDFSQVTIPITVPNTTISNNKWLQVRVVVPGGDYDRVLLAYGTAAYRANATLPKI